MDVAGRHSLLPGTCLCLALLVFQMPWRCAGSELSVTGAVERARSSANRAELAQAWALRAVDNAWAANSEAADAFLKALQGVDGGLVEACGQRVRNAWKGTEDALAKAEQIARCAERCLQAAGGVQALDRQTATTAADADNARAAKDAKRMADTAESEAEDAMKLALELKQKWLVPAATSSNAAALPEAGRPAADAGVKDRSDRSASVLP